MYKLKRPVVTRELSDYISMTRNGLKSDLEGELNNINFTTHFQTQR